MSDKLILNVEDAAGLLCCATSTVREAARTGRLPGLKFGEDWVFPRDAFLSSLNRAALDAQYERNKLPPVTPVIPGVTGDRISPRARPTPNLDAFTPVGGNA